MTGQVTRILPSRQHGGFNPAGQAERPARLKVTKPTTKWPQKMQFTLTKERKEGHAARMPVHVPTFITSPLCDEKKRGFF